MTEASFSFLNDPHLTDLRREVFQGVGKSIYLYQEVEKRLKFLNVFINLNFDWKGDQASWQKQLEKQQTIFNEKTMGALMGKLIDAIFVTPEEYEPSSINLGFRFQFRIETTSEFIEQKKSAMKSFVDDRNYLVHHYFEQVNFADAEELKLMVERLTNQHALVNSEIKWLIELMQFYKEVFEGYESFLNSANGLEELERMRLQNTLPINYLEVFANDPQRKDGWSILDTAISLAKKSYPEETTELLEVFNLKSLYYAARKVELFEFKYEETMAGRRLLYKNKEADYCKTFNL